MLHERPCLCSLSGPVMTKRRNNFPPRTGDVVGIQAEDRAAKRSARVAFAVLEVA